MNMKSNECNVITSPFHLYICMETVYVWAVCFSLARYICVCLQVYLSILFLFDTLFCLPLCLLLLTRLKNIIDILIKFVHHKSVAKHNRMKNIHTPKVKEWKSKVSEHLIRLYFSWERGHDGEWVEWEWMNARWFGEKECKWWEVAYIDIWHSQLNYPGMMKIWWWTRARPLCER